MLRSVSASMALYGSKPKLLCSERTSPRAATIEEVTSREGGRRRDSTASRRTTGESRRSEERRHCCQKHAKSEPLDTAKEEVERVVHLSLLVNRGMVFLQIRAHSVIGPVRREPLRR